MDWQLLLMVSLAIGLGSFIKGVSGLGLPVIAIPVLAAFVGVQHAVAVMLVPIICTNAWQMWQFRAHRDGAAFLWRLIPTGLVGIAIGTWGLKELPTEALSLSLAAIVFAYVALTLIRPNFRLDMATGTRIAPAIGFASGLLQGATGLSSPILLTYLHALRLERPVFIFAVSSVFVALAVAQIPALAFAGILTGERFLQGVLVMVPVLVMMPLGNLVSAQLSNKVFDRLVLGLLVLIALELIRDAVM